MKAVILAAGEGNRLRPITSSRPKPIVPIAGKNIDYLLSIINYLLLILLLDYYLKVNKYRINIILLLTIIKCYILY